jgi:hypothetical protein
LRSELKLTILAGEALEGIVDLEEKKTLLEENVE